MKFSTRSVIGLALLVTLSASAFALVAQDKKEAAAPVDEMMARPAPEHALLQKWIGTWDAQVTELMGPAPVTTKGTMVCRAMGPLWVVSDFKGEMMGGVFEGHEISGWDPNTKKYTSVWCDTLNATAASGSGAFDAATRTMTMHMDMNMGGQATTMTNVMQWKNDDTVSFSMSMPGPDGKLATGLKIEYKRRK